MRRSISRAISRLAEQDPARVVVTAADGELTAADLDRRASALARAYADLGVRRDDLVTVALPSSAEAVVVCCAVWRAGATPQPLDAGVDDEELAAVVRLARPALVVGRDPGAQSGGAQGGDAQSGGAAGGGAAGGGAAGAGASPVPWVPAGWVPPTSTSTAPLPDVWARSWKAPTSSGSTGTPKVVVSTAPALVDPEVPAAPFLPLRATQLVVAPITGSAAFTYAFRGLMTGHRLVLVPPGERTAGGGRPDPRAVLAALVRHRVTWVQLSPAVLGDLVRLPVDEREAADLSALEAVVHLGSRCDPEVKRAAIAWLGAGRVVEVYAGSESHGLCLVDGREWLGRPGTVGRPASGTEVAVRRPDGADADVGEVGEVWMRRPGGPTYRYLGGTSRRTDDGWDSLGDLGRLDAGGYLFLEDRAGDVLVRDGVRVVPADVEHVLERHPGVRGAVVSRVRGAGAVSDGSVSDGSVSDGSVSDGSGGDGSAADVPGAGAGERAGQDGELLSAMVDVTGSTTSRADLDRWCAEHLPPAARPDVLEVVRTPVRSTTGKVRRRG